MTVRDMIQDMINELTEAIADAEKHDSGNNAAGTRVRKVMQTCKSLAQDVRVKIQGDKNLANRDGQSFPLLILSLAP